MSVAALERRERGRPLPLEGQGDGGIGVERNTGAGVGWGAAAGSARGGVYRPIAEAGSASSMSMIGMSETIGYTRPEVAQ